MTTDAPVGVVVMAYGTPARPDDIEAYYTHIRRGRRPEPEQLADLVARYEAIGGISPLAERTEAQRAAIEAALEGLAPGGYRVVLGQKHAAPFIEDAVAALAEDGVRRTVGLVLAPHYSGASVGQYQARATEAAATHGIDHREVRSWHLLEEHVAFLADAVDEARAALPERHKVLFTAHSLPERVLVDDPYVDELHEGAAAVAARVGLDRWAGWGMAWQSAGRTPEPWVGPDLSVVLRQLAELEAGRTEAVLVCPHGFVSDHLEVLFDLDIEAAAVADDIGLGFARTRVVNDDPAVMGGLARLVHATATDPR